MNIQTERNLNKTYKILWLDDEVAILEAAHRALRTLPIEFIGVQSIEKAKEIVESQRLALIVSDQRLPDGSGIEFLEWVRFFDGTPTRILLTGYLDSPVIEDAVNRAAVFRFISKPWQVEELRRDLLQGLQHFELSLQKQSLLREYANQNRRLEELTSSLEKVVQERTHSEEIAKREVEEKANRTRDLVRFIQELSFSQSLEDILLHLTQDLKKFPEVRAPILGYRTPENRTMLVYLLGRQAFEKISDEKWPETKLALDSTVSQDAHQHYLAQIFGRPFMRILTLSLEHDEKKQSGVPASILYVEHTLRGAMLAQFQDHMSDRFQPLALALERILLEYQLKYISFQWAKTFDAIKDPIAIVDLDYQLIRSNRSFGVGFERRCHKEFANLDEICRGCPVEQSLKSGESRSGRIKRGERIYLVHSYPIRMAGDERVTNVINHYLDVTTERELQSKVIQNEKMAAVGLFAGHIAHELNNPLTGLRSLAQILLREVENEGNLKSDLQEIEKAAGRSQKIIENLLNFSSPYQKPVREVIDLSEVVQKTLPILKTAMREHNYEGYFSEEKLLILVEPHLMQQVVFNLINNACQAMSEPGTLTLTTKKVLRENTEWAAFLVRDTGVGIASDHIRQIFEPFFTTKEEGKGTGLGLSMSLSIVREFGGEILLESEWGKGTVFEVLLPLAKE